MIVFDSQKMIERYHEIRNINRQLQQNIEKIEKLVLSIEGEWQGNSGKAYVDKLIYVKSKFNVLNCFYDEYSELLKQYAEMYENHEKELLLKISRV